LPISFRPVILPCSSPPTTRELSSKLATLAAKASEKYCVLGLRSSPPACSLSCTYSIYLNLGLVASEVTVPAGIVICLTSSTPLHPIITFLYTAKSHFALVVPSDSNSVKPVSIESQASVVSLYLYIIVPLTLIAIFPFPSSLS